MREAAQYAPPLYAARCGPAPAHTRLTLAHLASSIAVGAMNIHDVRDRQTDVRYAFYNAGGIVTPNLNGVEIPCLRSDARSYFETFIRIPAVSELKIALEKMWDNFPQVQSIKLSRVIETV